MRRTPYVWLALGFALALLSPTRASAIETSKIEVPLELLVAGEGSGSLRSVMMDDGARAVATMQVKVRHLIPHHEYRVMGDGAEIARIATNAAGNGGISVDLFHAVFDPRGKFVSVHDGYADVLGAWVYADPADDPPRAKIKQSTILAPADGAAPAGYASARYELLPNGRSRFGVGLHGVAAGDYDVAVDGMPVGSVTTDAGGNVWLRFASHPLPGGKRHEQLLDFDPRSKQIEVSQGGVLVFAGPMLAQIAGLVPQCTPSSTSIGLVRGAITTGVEGSCDLTFDVEVWFVPVGSYDVVVDGVLVGAMAVADDGSGWVSGSIHFDQTPDAGELPLDFAFGPGSLVEVRGGVIFSTTLP